ncbi:hypothetical protein ILUMI_21233 [Ignelater luminosus]|uniref:Major facilitator superfamily (MFS) profile domain-containing protein n=1 Tax=Ignelater luminosus TaxID=2038154 RepID=A0A8K0G3T7_IGNLU|nr:hypothetical protein ILUMI_21233 [Ignelater luminosus]
MRLFSALLNRKQNGSLYYQYLATFTGSIAIICTEMHFGWPSPSLPQLLQEDSHIPMTSADGSWIAVMPCLGAAFGSITGALTVDRIGRKTCMLLVSPLHFITWLMVAFSPSVSILNVARFIVGIADGIAFTAFPMYIGEISDSKIRGFLGSSISVTTMLGFLLINVIGSYFSIRDTALISSALPVLHFITFISMPESPYFLLMKQKPEQAEMSLKKLKGMEDVKEEVLRLNLVVKEETENSGKFLDLFTVRSNRKAGFIIMGVRGIQQLSGITAITFYSQIIFDQAEIGISPSTATSIYFAVQLIVTIFSSILVDKIGRRPLLIVSVIGSGTFLALEGLYFYFQTQTNIDVSKLSFLPLTSLLLYVIIFNLGMGTVPVLMLSELFPTNVKAFALCIADIYFGIIVTLVSKFFQMMNDDFGMYVPFFAFTVCCAVGLIFIVTCVPETKDKSLEEIQQYLKGEDVKKNEKTNL